MIPWMIEGQQKIPKANLQAPAPQGLPGLATADY